MLSILLFVLNKYNCFANIINVISIETLFTIIIPLDISIIGFIFLQIFKYEKNFANERIVFKSKKQREEIKMQDNKGAEWGVYNKINNTFISVDNVLFEDGRRTNELRDIKSYLVVGEAGVGKTTMLKQYYRHYNNSIKSRIWNIFTRRFVMYISVKSLIEDQEFFKLLIKTHYRRLILICDGLDEVGETSETMKQVLSELKK